MTSRQEVQKTSRAIEGMFGVYTMNNLTTLTTDCCPEGSDLNLDRPQRRGNEISLDRPAHGRAPSSAPPEDVAPGESTPIVVLILNCVVQIQIS